MESKIKTLKEYKKDMEDFFVERIEETIQKDGIEVLAKFYNPKAHELVLNYFLDTITYIDPKGVRRIPFESKIKKYFWKRANKIVTKYQKDNNIVLYDKYGDKIEFKNTLDADALNKTSTILLIIFFFPIVFIFMLFKSLTKAK